jgi:hypothetical protein
MSAAPIFSQSEDGRPLVAVVIGMAFHIAEDGLAPFTPQPPVKVGGEYNGEPGSSSWKYEPQIAFTKPATDVALIGHAVGEGRTSVEVALQVGALRHSARVTGDRYWTRSMGMISMTPPEPLDRMPLIYEHAFGGWDRSDPDPNRHACDRRNPVGMGFRSKNGRYEEGVLLPNIENPRDPVRSYGQAVSPIGFGFTSPDWPPRAEFAGSYDDAWMLERRPLLPHDFDRRFFNAASPGLIAAGYLKGDEAVSIENASIRGRISFDLPGVPPPECRVRFKGGTAADLTPNLDTVIVNTDEDLLWLIWRCHATLKSGPHDILSIRVAGTKAAAAAGW